MPTSTLSLLERNLEIADQLRVLQLTGFEPQILPEPFGSVVRVIDGVLAELDMPAALCGDWAVWRYGYPRRISDDLDIVVPHGRIDEFIATACGGAFDDATCRPGFASLVHRESGIRVDILPGPPGDGRRLRFIDLPSLVVMKLVADRPPDRSDLVSLFNANPGQVDDLRAAALALHIDYAPKFDALVRQAHAELDD